MKKKIFASLATALLLCTTGASMGMAHADVINDTPNISVQSIQSEDLGIDLGTRYITSWDTRITGTTTRPNCDIIVYFSSGVYTGKSGDDGKFTVNIDKHPAGTEFIVEAVDPNTLDIATVKSIIHPRLPNLETLTSGLTSLNGVADPNIEIHLEVVRGNTTFKFSALSDAQGSFSIPLKDYNNNPLPLAVGDKLTYYTTMPELGLDSDTTTITIHAH